MRKIVLILAVTATNLLLPSKSKGQNSVYIITEVYPANAPFFDSVYVTTPTGSVTAYQIPYNSNVAGHDAALNLIVNGVTTLGYIISEYSYNRSFTAGPQTRFVTRWFLKKP